MKRASLVLISLSIVLIIGVAMVNKLNCTKVPFNNGFYAGPYDPSKPVIDPTK